MIIIDIQYEELINSTSNQISILLRSCDLSWDDKCLEFYNNKRPIKTASDKQARKKIYKTSLNTWKNYEKFLNEPFKKLPN